MSEPPRILLEHRLKMLKLPTFLREYEKVARQSAHEGLDHVRFLARLVELELIDRERRLVERRIKAAKFPTVKSLDSFEVQGDPVGEQGPGPRAPPVRMDRASRERDRSRAERDGEESRGPRAGIGRMPARNVSTLRHRRRRSCTNSWRRAMNDG